MTRSGRQGVAARGSPIGPGMAQELVPSMADHLEREQGRNSWQARIDIPVHPRHLSDGKRVLVKNLQTSNRTVAKERAKLVLAR